VTLQYLGRNFVTEYYGGNEIRQEIIHMSITVVSGSKGEGSAIAGMSAPAVTCDWLELEFFTQTQILSGRITCPAGTRILDLLNTPCNSSTNRKIEFIEFEDHTNPEAEAKSICVKKDSVLFVSAPDEDMGRGLGANGEFKLYPFVTKIPMRVCIQLENYTVCGNLFRTKNQQMIDVFNDGMFFLPLTDVTIARDSVLWGNRPFVAVNKQQIVSATME
jgi:hypothetical protein